MWCALTFPRTHKQAVCAITSNSLSCYLSCLLTRSFLLLPGCQGNKDDIKWKELSLWRFQAKAERPEGGPAKITERRERWKGTGRMNEEGKRTRRSRETKRETLGNTVSSSEKCTYSSLAAINTKTVSTNRKIKTICYISRADFPVLKMLIF